MGVRQKLRASLPQSPAGDSSSYEEEPEENKGAARRAAIGIVACGRDGGAGGFGTRPYGLVGKFPIIVVGEGSKPSLTFFRYAVLSCSISSFRASTPTLMAEEVSWVWVWSRPAASRS